MVQILNKSTATIQILPKGAMLAERLRISAYAQKNLTAQQAHRQIRKSGSKLSPNPFYDGHSTPEDSYQKLNSDH